MHLGNSRDGGHDRNGRLTAAGHHVQVRGVEVLFKVDHRYAVGADGRRGEVDDSDARLRGKQLRAVDAVRAGGGSVEDDAEVGEDRGIDQPVDSGVNSLKPKRARFCESIRFRVDSDERDELDVAVSFGELVHQVGSDVSGPDDGCGLCHKGALLCVHNLEPGSDGVDTASRDRTWLSIENATRAAKVSLWHA